MNEQYAANTATVSLCNKRSCLIGRVITAFSRIPDSLIALIGRFSVAAIFWKSGQTKVQDFAIDIVAGEFTIGWPRLSDSVVDLFREEYRLPLIPPEWAALMAAFAEHVFPALLLIGLATRFSALALLGMKKHLNAIVRGAYDRASIDAAVQATIESADLQEGGTAWREKRQPLFTGR